jgi:ribosomal protein S18 acetylase RimI-like enzyme
VEGAASPAVTIREAGEADLPRLSQLLAQLGEPATRAPTREQAAALFARMQRSPNHRVYVAESSGGVVGAYALLVMDSLAHPDRPAAVVEDVVVDGEFRRHGIGRAMMQHALAQARSHGCFKLALSSNSRRGDAHRFYESLGFERHGLSFAVFLDSA